MRGREEEKKRMREEDERKRGREEEEEERGTYEEDAIEAFHAAIGAVGEALLPGGDAEGVEPGPHHGLVQVHEAGAGDGGLLAGAAGDEGGDGGAADLALVDGVPAVEGVALEEGVVVALLDGHVDDEGRAVLQVVQPLHLVADGVDVVLRVELRTLPVHSPVLQHQPRAHDDGQPHEAGAPLHALEALGPLSSAPQRPPSLASVGQRLRDVRVQGLAG